MPSTPDTPAASRAEPTPAALAAAKALYSRVSITSTMMHDAALLIDTVTNLPALLRDKRRLDWLENQSASLIWSDNGFWYLATSRAFPNGETPRAAIDAAASKAEGRT